MKEITLSRGSVVLVDDEDYEFLNQSKWSLKDGRYARSTTGDFIHVEVAKRMGIWRPDREVDHRDRDGLNNRRENLRVGTHAQNMRNIGPYSTNSSGYKGVCWDKSRNKWLASISINNRFKNLGRFDTAEEAASPYNRAAIQVSGDFAFVNALTGSSQSACVGPVSQAETAA